MRLFKNMAPKTFNRSAKGFTLFEMLIALVVASMMMVALSEALAPAIAFYGKQETISKINDLRLAVEAAYKEDTTLVDSVPGNVFTLKTGVISEVLPVNGVCATPENTFLPIARVLPTSATQMARDGHGQGFCVFITPRQTVTAAGVKYFYHSVAVVSAGYDGAVDANTKLSSDGVLTLAGDDKGVLVDGKRLMGTKVEQAITQLDRATASLTSYFRTRFLSNPSRDISVNYFANTDKSGNTSGAFDASGAIPNTGGIEVPITTGSIHETLGLSLFDVTDPWGNLIRFDNSSDNVRNPQNGSPAKRLPGYTARVSITLPSNEIITRTIVGAY